MTDNTEFFRPDDIFEALSDHDDRRSFQIDQWVLGNPMHDHVTGRCCPDSSCCSGSQPVPVNIRAAYRRAYLIDGIEYAFQIPRDKSFIRLPHNLPSFEHIDSLVELVSRNLMQLETE